MNIVLIDLAAIVMFRIKKLTPMADKSATWKAVTDFRAARSRSLYHAAAPEVPPEKKAPAATFTPATQTEEAEEEKAPVEKPPPESENGS
jgi:hypothetical protein